MERRRAVRVSSDKDLWGAKYRTQCVGLEYCISGWVYDACKASGNHHRQRRSNLKWRENTLLKRIVPGPNLLGINTTVTVAPLPYGLFRLLFIWCLLKDCCGLRAVTISICSEARSSYFYEMPFSLLLWCKFRAPYCRRIVEEGRESEQCRALAIGWATSHRRVSRFSLIPTLIHYHHLHRQMLIKVKVCSLKLVFSFFFSYVPTSCAIIHHTDTHRQRGKCPIHPSFIVKSEDKI
jgi:hypothetical protein